MAPSLSEILTAAGCRLGVKWLPAGYTVRDQAPRAHPSIDIGAMLILRPEPPNRFDKNAIANRQSSDRWSDRLCPGTDCKRVRGHGARGPGWFRFVLGIWKKRRLVGLGVVGSVGRHFGITTD